MNKYELVTIVDAVNPQEEKEQAVKQAQDIVTKAGGKVINNQVWIEKQRFSFLMKKKKEGTYYLINFEGKPSILGSIRSALKLNEKILRSLIIKVE